MYGVYCIVYCVLFSLQYSSRTSVKCIRKSAVHHHPGDILWRLNRIKPNTFLSIRIRRRLSWTSYRQKHLPTHSSSSSSPAGCMAGWLVRAITIHWIEGPSPKADPEKSKTSCRQHSVFVESFLCVVLVWIGEVVRDTLTLSSVDWLTQQGVYYEITEKKQSRVFDFRRVGSILNLEF